MPFKIYAADIDKQNLVRQYNAPISPYKLCLTFIFERILKDIPPHDTCQIILESRGNNEDRQLLEEIKKILDFGTRYYSSTFFNRICGVYFNPKWCKKENDKQSYWELEIADLCAYPMRKYFAYNKKDPSVEVLLPKISYYPYYWGKGIKKFP